jgi:hypothetical protein
MPGTENEPLSETELHELEGVMERHKTLHEIGQAYGVFTSFCIPRLLATIRNLQRDLDLITKERDDARDLLRNLNG